VVPQGELFGLDLQQALRTALEGQLHSWKADVLLETRNGESRWVTDSSVILRDPEGGMLGSVGILADITDRKRAEEALRLGEERFRTLVTNLQVIAFALDARGVFTLSEGLGLEKLGQRPGQLVGLSVFDVYGGNPEFLAQVRRALSGESVLAELGLMGLTFELRYTPVRDPRGEPGGVIAVAFDITERTKAEEQIRALNLDLERRVRDRTARLEAANRELEAFAYSVSHDLRAPLRAVDGFSQALLEDYATFLDARGKGYLERIRSGAARMGDLIEDLLRLSRLSNAEIRLEEVDLSSMVGSIAADLRESSPGRQVDFVITPDIRVVADRALALIALENLLRNAWKFTGRRTDARIEFGRLSGESGEVVCYVQDNGAGFDMAYASKLFGVFQRLHDQQEFPGSGIGLATVQRILHRHGGRVWAEGEVNRGATVYFQFPAGALP
jgi:PAS domain S-box-containing protein